MRAISMLASSDGSARTAAGAAAPAAAVGPLAASADGSVPGVSLLTATDTGRATGHVGARQTIASGWAGYVLSAAPREGEKQLDLAG